MRVSKTLRSRKTRELEDQLYACVLTKTFQITRFGDAMIDN